MPDSVTVTYITVIGMIIGGAVTKTFDFLVARIQARLQKPGAYATAEETQAKAAAIVAENQLRMITRIDDDNKRLQKRLDDSDRSMATMRADYEARISVLEAGRKADKVIIEAQGETIKRQTAQLRELTNAVIARGGNPPDFTQVNGRV